LPGLDLGLYDGGCTVETNMLVCKKGGGADLAGWAVGEAYTMALIMPWLSLRVAVG
jgi:hypothetical protein